MILQNVVFIHYPSMCVQSLRPIMAGLENVLTPLTPPAKIRFGVRVWVVRKEALVIGNGTGHIALCARLLAGMSNRHV